MFVDRKKELSMLNSLLASREPKLIILYGRRRVGKTELLEHFSRLHSGLYFLARQEAEKDQLKMFSGLVADYFKDESLRLSPFQNYDSFFTYLKDRLPEGVPVIFDEFPYMVEANHSVPSILQHYWDQHFQKRKTFMVFCGSSMRMMERLAGYKSPIYGRRTEQIFLPPLGFADAREFMKDVAPIQAVEFYSVLGGTPGYLQLFDYSKSLKDNLVEKMLNETAFLNQDAMFILREELDEPRNYFSILKSISKGNTQLGAIMNDTGLGRSVVSKYISVLIELRIVERRVPITERERSRRGLYFIRDPYFNFWFRFVFENAAYLESAGAEKAFTDRIAPNLNAYFGRIFEDIAMEWICFAEGGFAFGRWWEKDEEIDIVGLDETKNRMILIEVKWSPLSEKGAREILDSLARKSTKVRWKEGCSKKLGLIAKKIEGKKTLRKEGFYAMDLNDIVI